MNMTMIYANLIVWTALFIVSVYFALKMRKKNSFFKDTYFWNSCLFALTALLFIQLYIRVINGNVSIPADEVRYYIFVSGFSMFASMFSTAVKHGVIDGIFSKIIK